MRRYLILILTCFCLTTSYAQQEQVSFSEVISLHLPKYKKHADKAYRTNNVERANFLFDSLVSHVLKGSYLDNFKVRDLKKKPVFLNHFEKPVYLTTYASWIVPTAGEIPALNKLAEKYSGQVDFVMLFWDDNETAREMAKKYSKNITILYVDEMQNSSPYVIKVMKHSLGFPTSFLLDKDKKILDIRRKISHPFGMDFKKSLSLNYDSFSNGLSLLLIKESSQYSTAEGTVAP
jgi:thiol-disulfide isomerase/thioredoxin